MPSRIARLLCAGLLCLSASARAQDAMPDAPAHVSYVEGAAVLERDGQPDTSPENMPLLGGDRIRTDAGRVEILFTDGSTLYLDERTTVDFESDELVRLLEGRLRLAIAGPERQVQYRVDAPAGSVNIGSPGEYRISILGGSADPQVELAVLRGSAELVNDDGRTALRAGERAVARGNAPPSYAYAFNSAAWDAFDRWSEARRGERAGVSSQYLPTEIRPYAASFDRNGSWQYDASYGYVWYPAVSAGWRPYYNGRWVTLRPYGWTWVGADVWDWPTHHYGRWGLSAGLWFWIPGRSWAPAWVSWAYAPGYVSWCPLGWNNRPVVQIASGAGRGADRWHAWTAVPERQFGSGNVRRIVAGDRDVHTVRAFVAGSAAPPVRAYAAPRAAPVRAAGTRSRPQSSSPVYTNLDPAASRVSAGGSRTVVGASRRTAPGDTTSGTVAGRAVDRVPGPAAGADRSGTPANTAGSGVTSRSAPIGAAPSRRPAGPIYPQPHYGMAGGAAAGAQREAVPLTAPRSPSPYGSQGRGPNAAPSGRPGDAGVRPGGIAVPRAPASPGPGGGELYGPRTYPAPPPGARAPEHAPDPGPRTAPRAEPRGGERPAPESRPASGGDRGGASGAPAQGGRAHSGGRGR